MLLATFSIQAQGIEDFANSNASSSYADNSFVGNNGVTWTYVASRDANSDANNSDIDLPALMLQKSSNNSAITSSTISGGIVDFSVKLYKGFTGGGNRQVELFINGVSKGTSAVFDDFDEHIFTVTGINITGDIIIQLVNTTAKQVIVDDITWTVAGTSTAPVIDDIALFPTAPTASDAVNVYATVTDDDVITSAKVYWSTETPVTTTTGTEINMSSSGDVYSTTSTISAQAAGTTVYYVVWATDGTYTTTSTEMSYTIPSGFEPITFFFKGPSWMDNNPTGPEVWGPFESSNWTSETLTYSATTSWWSATVNVTPAKADLTYQMRFSQDGTVKYQKATGDFSADATYTTTTGEVWIDGSDNDNDSYLWSGNDFYLSADKITETEPAAPATKLSFEVEPSNVIVNEIMIPALEVTAVDANNDIVATYTGTVVLTFNGTGTMGGTYSQTAVAGVATFNDLTFDTEGLSYTITATATGLTYTVSATFDVTAVPPAPEVFISEIAGRGYNAGYEDEYIELTNLGSSILSLDGWSLEYWEDNGGFSIEQTMIFDNTNSINSNSTFVIAARSEHTTAITPDFQGSISFNHSGCYIVLKNENGDVIDQAGTSSDDFADKNYEFTNCGGDNLTVASWTNLDVANGTPGVLNCGGTPIATLEITAPSNGSTTNNTTVSVVCDIENFELGTDGYISYNLNGGTTYSSTTTTFDLTGLAYDTYTLTATLVDMNGDVFTSTVTYTVTFTVEAPVIPTQLAITLVTPTSPVVDATFAITVEAQDGTGTVANVTEDTEVMINLATGTGALSGTVTGTILNGTSAIVITDLSYDVIEAIEVNASVTTKGMALTTSANISITITDTPAATLFISEYIECITGNDKAVEIYNPTGATIDLTGYTVKLASNANNWDNTADLTGFLDAGEVFVISNADAAAPTIVNNSDMTSNITWFNGNDAVGLFYMNVLIDVIGIEGANVSQDVAGVVGATTDNTLIRKYPEVTTGNTDWATSAGTDADNSEWIVTGENDFTHIGWHGVEPTPTPSLTITAPSNGSTVYNTTVSVDFNVTNFVVANTTGDGYVVYDLDGTPTNLYTTTSFDITDLTSGSHTITMSLVDNEGTALDPAVTYTVTFTVELLETVSIYNIQNTDVAGDDGTYPSLYLDQTVTTSGIVTAVQGNSYYIQDGNGAWNGIYVYDNTNTPTIGDDLTIVTEVDEYYGLTELKNVSEYTVNSQGNTLPVATTLSTLAANDEQYEGVLIKVLAATCTNTDADHGRWVIDDNSGELFVGTDMLVYTPTATYTYDVTGLGFYSYDAYKIIPRDLNDIVVEANTEPTLTITSPANASTITVSNVDVTFEVLNFTFGEDGEVKYTITNGTTATTQTSPISFTDLEDGDYTVDLELVDISGAPLATPVTASVSFTIDLGDNVNELTSNITIYPNPVVSTLNIDTENINTISIYNTLGQLVTEINVNSNNTQINVNNWSKGVYFIKLSNNENTITKTIVKQ